MDKSKTTKDRCQVFGVNRDRISRAKKDMPPADTLQELAEFYKILGDPTRIRILSALAHEELCVCDIFTLLEMDQSAVSHQLKLLRISRLVKVRREGRMMYYSLNDRHISDIFRCGLEHVEEGAEHSQGKGK